MRTLIFRAPRRAHFDGTYERIAALPYLYDGTRPASYGGVPERRTLGGVARACRDARAYSASHRRTRCTVFVSIFAPLRVYISGVRRRDLEEGGVS
jgi:hypothetical protein